MIILRQIKAITIACLLLLFLLLPTCLIAAPFGLARRLKIICPVWSLCSKILLKYCCLATIGFEEDLRGEEFRTVPYQGIYVANHQSYVDIPLIITHVQAPPIMKSQVLYIPLFGQLGWVSGAIPVSRDRVNSRKKVFEIAKKRLVSKKIGIQIYPEGTRSKDGTPRSYETIKRTLLVFAFNEKIPVIPVSLYGTCEVLDRWGFVRPHKKIGIISHKEIWPQDYNSCDEFCRAVWSQVISGHGKLKSLLS